VQGESDERPRERAVAVEEVSWRAENACPYRGNSSHYTNRRTIIDTFGWRVDNLFVWSIVG